MLILAIGGGVFLLGVGFVIGVMAGRVTAEDRVQIKVVALHKLFQDVLKSQADTTAALNKAMLLQDDTIKTLQKEKHELVEQLQSATDSIAELQELVEDESNSGSEDDDDDDKEGDIETSVVVADHIPQLSKRATDAQDKLITIARLLEDAKAKGESINPATVLGIVRFDINKQ